jgi:ABC-type dipeptide/oligopeptide/nickel transport system ATPase subunit
MTLSQALRLHTDLDEAARRARARELLEQVNLPPSYLDKYPDALSGGQKRRVGICRALATEPDAIVADEPFSGLDISLQEQIVDLTQEIQDAHDLTTLLISHDTGLMRHLCDRIGIMQAGQLVEVLPTGKMTPEHCEHPYAESLLRTHFNVRRQST